MKSINDTQPSWREDILQAILTVTQRKLLVVGVFSGIIMICIAVIATTEPFYRSSASIVLLPREKPILDIAAQSETLESSDETARKAQASSLTLPPNPELYETLIRSNDLAARIHDRIDSDTMSAESIRSSIHVNSSEEGLLTIRCQASDPKLAAQIVSLAIEECEMTSKTIERQLMIQQKGYLDGTIDNIQGRVASLISKINTSAEEFGVSEPEQAASRSLARIRRLDEAQIRLQTKLQGLQIHRTNLDPMVVALKAELSSVLEERDRISENFCGQVSESSYSRMLAGWKGLHQELNQSRDLLMSLRAKRDLFVIRAEQPSGNLAIIRAPSVPIAPSGPSKRRAISIGLLSATVVSLLACVIADQISRASREEHSGELIVMIRKSISPSSLICWKETS
ncbi:MAG: hypothetical protein P1U42_04205 [Phycisphaerales bacterium]|nr:hypothetical protein [Phycisphaerales bacterium]